MVGSWRNASEAPDSINAPVDLMSPSHLSGHQTCKWYPDIHAGKTPIIIKYVLKNDNAALLAPGNKTWTTSTTTWRRGIKDLWGRLPAVLALPWWKGRTRSSWAISFKLQRHSSWIQICRIKAVPFSLYSLKHILKRKKALPLNNGILKIGSFYKVTLLD